MSEYNWAQWLNRMKTKNMIWDEENKCFKKIEDLEEDE